MTKQWNPLNDLMQLQDRMNRLFEDANDRRARVASENGSELENADWHPAADVYDQDNEYLIAIDLPGVDRSALEINLDDDNKLVIRGTRVLENNGQQREHPARPHGRFLKTFTIPSQVNQEAIAAEYRNGVLEVVLPKLPETHGKKIAIKVT